MHTKIIQFNGIIFLIVLLNDAVYHYRNFEIRPTTGTKFINKKKWEIVFLKLSPRMRVLASKQHLFVHFPHNKPTMSDTKHSTRNQQKNKEMVANKAVEELMAAVR